ncbi:D-2-hydroxyacid dehydrogenase family protein [Erwinia sp. BNK-24-b]|uniref:D-2-hydroxyacid dehydrogenase family protein n=1 Tax=unclassified Erwinia TaxID=2622719 RepID=UPI0039BEE991
MAGKCIILDDYQNVATKMADWQTLDKSLTIECLHHHLRDRHQLVEALQQAVVIVVMRERTVIDRELLAQLPGLRLIVTSGMRNAAIDIAAAKEKGITVCGTASGSEPPAELTWSLLLALAKNLLPEQHNLTGNGPWQSSLGTTLAGKNIGIIGLGKIGQRIARYAQAFEMNVYAWSPHLTAQRAQEAGVTFVAEKSALLAQSDFVTLHLVCAPATQGIIGWNDLQQMKPSAYLINTSRAALIEQGALLRALENNVIAGAAVDVFEEEPLAADSPYRQSHHLLATPHLGYVSDSNYRTYFTQAIEDINGWLAGKPVREL